MAELTEAEAYQMALASNLNYLVAKNTNKMALAMLEVMTIIDNGDSATMEDAKRMHQLLDTISAGIVKNKGIVGVMMDYYGDSLGPYEKTEMADKVQNRIKNGNDLIMAMELVMRMNAEDHLAQLMFGKGN